VPLPYNRRLEQMALPQVADIIHAVKDVLYIK
jgi:pyruvate/2-oxoglutarate/acetoin dehydrogenase E1 component